MNRGMPFLATANMAPEELSRRLYFPRYLFKNLIISPK